MRLLELQPFSAPDASPFREELETIEGEISALYARLTEISSLGVLGRIVHAKEAREIQSRIDELLVEKKNKASERERIERYTQEH